MMSLMNTNYEDLSVKKCVRMGFVRKILMIMATVFFQNAMEINGLSHCYSL